MPTLIGGSFIFGDNRPEASVAAMTRGGAGVGETENMIVTVAGQGVSMRSKHGRPRARSN